MKIIGRVASWAEAGGRIWAAHWLLIAGTFLAGASPVLRWLNFPLSRQFTGLQLPIIRRIGLIPHRYLLSYGLLALAVIAIGLLSLRISRWLLPVAAAVLLTMFAVLPCQVAFEQPALLHRLTSEVTDVSLTRTFAKQYLPQNFGYVEEIPSHLELRTAWGRLNTAFSFLGLGWICFGFGSMLVSIYAINRVRYHGGLATLVLVSLPLGTVGILLTKPLLAQHYFQQARVAQALGHNQEAIADYRRAIWWDRWYEEDVETYAIIGDLQRQSHLAEGSPERHIKRACVLRAAEQYEAALFEFGQAAGAGGPPAVVARREAARTRLDFGLALYRAGAVGGAVSSWRLALAENPAQLQGFVFLARGNYDLARYQSALETTEQLFRAAGLNTVLANAYSLAGDCYIKLGQDGDARRCYARSIKLDNDFNLWAAAGLVGN